MKRTQQLDEINLGRDETGAHATINSRVICSLYPISVSLASFRFLSLFSFRFLLFSTVTTTTTVRRLPLPLRRILLPPPSPPSPPRDSQRINWMGPSMGSLAVSSSSSVHFYLVVYCVALYVLGPTEPNFTISTATTIEMCVSHSSRLCCCCCCYCWLN